MSAAVILTDFMADTTFIHLMTLIITYLLSQLGWNCILYRTSMKWGSTLSMILQGHMACMNSARHRVPQMATWIGRRRVTTRCLPTRRGETPSTYSLHHGDAVWQQQSGSPPGQLRVVPDLLMGAFRQQPARLVREIRLRFPGGRQWSAPLRPGQEWHDLRRSVAHVMQIDRVLFDLEYDGQLVDYGAMVPADVHQVVMRWRHPAIRGRSRSREDRERAMVRGPGPALPPPVHRGGVVEDGAIRFHIELPGGSWRLTLHEHELGCELAALTVSRALSLLRWRYQELFERNRRYLMVAGRDVLLHEELVQPYLNNQAVLSVDAGAHIHPPDQMFPYPVPRPEDESNDEEEETGPPEVEPELRRARPPEMQDNDRRDDHPLQALGAAEVAYRPTVQQVFGQPQRGPT